jgi:hypothetical protein
MESSNGIGLPHKPLIGTDADELFPTKYVTATSRRIEMQHDLMPWKARL